MRCGRESSCGLVLPVKWRLPPELYGGTLRFATELHPDTAHAPQARGRAAQLRQGARGCARGVRRRRRVDGARGDRAPRRGRHRDALPPLPQPTGAGRGALSRGGRGGLPLGGRAARRRRFLGGAQRVVRALHRLPRHQAGARRRAGQLPRPRRRALQGQPRRAVRGGRAAAQARPGGRRGAPGRRHRRRDPDGHRDRQGPGRRSRGRPRTSSASRSTACATARTPSRRR